MKFSVPKTSTTQRDALKENKAFYDMPWDLINHQHLSITQHNKHLQHGTILSVSSIISSASTSTVTTTSMASSTKGVGTKYNKKCQTTFGKKEKTLSKNKTIIKATASNLFSDTIGFNNSDCDLKQYVKFNEHIQVPRKRIKVAATQLPKPSTLNDNFTLTNPIMANDKPIDPTSSKTSRQMPCCSLTITKPLSSLKNLSTTNSLTTNQQTPQQQSQHFFLKSLDCLGATTSSGYSNEPEVRPNNIPLSKKVSLDVTTKLKKKRSLKTEIGLKRKKPRAKTGVWH